MCLIQVVEDGYEFFAKRQLVTLFSAPNYCGDYDNAGGMMTVDEELMCSFQVQFYTHGKGTHLCGVEQALCDVELVLGWYSGGPCIGTTLKQANYMGASVYSVLVYELQPVIT